MKKLLKFVAYTAATLFGLIVLIIVIALATGETEPEAEEPEEVHQEEEMEEVQTYTITEQGQDILVEFEVRQALTESQTASIARADVLEGIERAASEYDDYDRIIVRATFPEGGFEGMVMNAGYNKATVDELAFSDEEADDIIDLKDSGSAHPSFSE